MEKPTWKNTLRTYLHSTRDELTKTAQIVGYPYIEWNGRILCTVDNGMHKIGQNCDFPLCLAEELDQPGGAQWNNGLRPILRDIKLMAHDTLREGTTLLNIISERLVETMLAIAWPNNGTRCEAIEAKIESVLEALDNYSLRGSDPDGSTAAAVAALRVRVDMALHLCK